MLPLRSARVALTASSRAAFAPLTRRAHPPLGATPSALLTHWTPPRAFSGGGGGGGGGGSGSGSGRSNPAPPKIHGDLRPSDVRSKAMRRKLEAKEAPAEQRVELTPTDVTRQEPPRTLAEAWNQAKEEFARTAASSQPAVQPAPPSYLQQQQPQYPQQQQQIGEPSFGQTMKFYVLAGIGMTLGMMFVRVLFGF